MTLHQCFNRTPDDSSGHFSNIFCAFLKMSNEKCHNNNSEQNIFCKKPVSIVVYLVSYLFDRGKTTIGVFHRFFNSILILIRLQRDGHGGICIDGLGHVSMSLLSNNKSFTRIDLLPILERIYSVCAGAFSSFLVRCFRSRRSSSSIDRQAGDVSISLLLY